MRKTVKFMLLAALCLALVAVVSGCGKKGLPKPPRYVEPPVVTNLAAANVEDGVLTIAWVLPWGEDDKYNLKGFNVYVAQDELATLCAECPPVFARIGEGKSTVSEDVRHYIFQMRVSEGYRYIYKVNAVGGEGQEGRDSNYLVFQF